MPPIQHFIASYTGLQTIIPAQRGQIHPLAPKMHPFEGWRERTGNIQLDYNGQDLTARLIMDDGTYSGLIIANLTSSQAQLVLHQKTLLLKYIKEEVQFTEPEKKNKNDNNFEPKSLPRKTTLYSLQLQGILLNDTILLGKTYSSLTPTTNQPLNHDSSPPLIQRYGSILAPATSLAIEQAKAFRHKPSIALNDPAATFLNYARHYELLDHEGEIILGKRKEVEAAQMNYALHKIISLQFPFNSALQHFFNTISKILKKPKSEPIEDEVTENHEMKYYASIREFFPFDKRQATSLIKKYTTSLEQVIHAATDQDRMTASTNLPWQEEKIQEIILLCDQYVQDYLNSPQPSTSDKHKSTAQLQSIRIIQSQTYLQEYIHAQKQFIEIVNTFTLKNTRMIPKLSVYYIKKGHDRSDILQYGLLGLRRAAIKYDWKLGYKFSTYAVWWIRQEMQRSSKEEESLIRMPIHMHDTKHKIIHFKSKFWNQHHRDPSLEEIALNLNFTIKKVQFVLSQQDHLISLDQKIGEDEDSSLLDFVNGSDEIKLNNYVHIPPSPETAAIQQNEETKMSQHLNRLDPREKKVLCLRFGIKSSQELTLEEVGKQFHLTRERIRQIESIALRKLEKIITQKSYQPLIKNDKQQLEKEAEEQEVA